MTDKTPLSSKVTYGAAGAAGATGVGFAVADLLTSLLKSGGWQPTEMNVTSIQVIISMLMAYAGSFLAGYMKDSGFTVEQQARELKEAKAAAKKE